MKKILFLTFSYPYGHFGPSDNCTVRIMNALAQEHNYEIWNISYKPKDGASKPNYDIVEGVNCLYLPFPEKRAHHSYIVEHFLLFLKIPIYPFFAPFSIWRHYKACKKLLRGKQFDLVITQCSPQDSVIAGALLRRGGYINKLMVLFWDNIYGKFPRKVIPKSFALYRSRKVENWIARYADCLISPSPFKQFHEQYGEVKEAIGKRVYLEHPSVLPPRESVNMPTGKFIKQGRINILYAGRVYFKEHISYCIDLLGKTSFAEQINLILLTKGLDESDLKAMSHNFKGEIVLSDWIPLDELNALYRETDICIAFSGYSSSSVSSKVYEYMCYGNPVVHFYEEDDDVTKKAISRYPLSMSICLRKDERTYVESMDNFIKNSLGKRVLYEDVERLFPDATGAAYVRVISSMVDR